MKATPAAKPAFETSGPSVATHGRPHAERGVQSVLDSAGHSLDPAASRYFGSRYNYDFSGIRVHSDASAARTARDLNAHAFTIGNHIVFGEGEYRPTRGRGFELIGHELAHAAQQHNHAADRGAPALASGSGLEQEAQRAAGTALVGGSPHLSRSAPRAIQRAEFGTYVSTVGEKDYLEAGNKFYQSWNYPNVRRFSNMSEVVENLATSKGPIDKFRVVSHGFGTSLETGLIPEYDSTILNDKQLAFTNEQAFLNDLDTESKLLDKQAFDLLLGIVQRDAAARPYLDTLKAGSGTLATTTSLGVVLLALCERYFLDHIELNDGSKPRIPNRTILDGFNNSRISTFRNSVVSATAKSDQAAVSGAIAALGTELPAALEREGRKWKLSQSDVDQLADPFLDPKAKTNRLRPRITADIREGGGGGPYLNNLRKVRSQITPATEIEIRGCTIGAFPAFMESLRTFFGGPGNLPKISAPDEFQFFYRLSYETFTKNPKDEAKLLDEFKDPATGVAESYRDLNLAREGKITVTLPGETWAAVSARTGLKEADLKTFNPKADPALPPATALWLRRPATKTVPIGQFTNLNDFSAVNLGSPHIWPAIWSLNPGIVNPKSLPAGGSLLIPESASAYTELLSKLRGGDAQVVNRKDTGRVSVYLNDGTAAKDLGAWLARERWDPNGRTAAQLSRLYAAGFGKAAAGTYIEFLSSDYPGIQDPIFPDDPRYASHIKKRP